MGDLLLDLDMENERERERDRVRRLCFRDNASRSRLRFLEPIQTKKFQLKSH